MLSGPMKDKNPAIVVSQTPKLAPSAWLPMLIPDLGLHSGVILALLMAGAGLVLPLEDDLGL